MDGDLKPGLMVALAVELAPHAARNERVMAIVVGRIAAARLVAECCELGHGFSCGDPAPTLFGVPVLAAAWLPEDAVRVIREWGVELSRPSSAAILEPGPAAR